MSSAGPKCIQLWKSNVITIIHEKVCAVNSPGGSHAEASEMLVLQRGDALANTGALLSEPALARPPAEPVQVPALPSPCEDVPTEMLKWLPQAAVTSTTTVLNIRGEIHAHPL